MRLAPSPVRVDHSIRFARSPLHSSGDGAKLRSTCSGHTPESKGHGVRRLISGRVACWERLLGRFVDGFLFFCFSDFLLRLEPVIKVRAWLIAPLDEQLVGS